MKTKLKNVYNSAINFWVANQALPPISAYDNTRKKNFVHFTFVTTK